MPVQPPLGSPVTLEFTETRVPLADDTLVIMFTDGVVERRDAPIDTGVDEVRDIAAVARWRSVDALADDLLEAVVGTNARDDRALVVVRHARSGGGFVSRGPGFEDVATDAQHAEREPSVIRP